MLVESLLKNTITPAKAIKPMINIGALLDIPTGDYEFGIHGESILNGGLGNITGIAGIGNNFKSTILHYQALSALYKISMSTYTNLSTYDTESNIHEGRLKTLAQMFFKDRDIFQEGLWLVTDSTIYSGNAWYEEFRKYLANKINNKKELMVDYPFLDRDGKTLLRDLIPTFTEIDSLSEFKTDDILEMQDKNQIGESGANTLHMRLGLAKTRILMDLPDRVSAAGNRVLITAHMGKDVPIQQGPIPTPANKQLSYLKNNDKIVGVGSKFFYSMSNLWHAYNAAPLINTSSRGEEYPEDSNNPKIDSKDLNRVMLRQLRSKSGKTGITLELIVSQSQGVLPTLTEFHYIKSMNRFGLSGNNVNYHLDLYPDLNLTRPTIRSKINSDPKLCRAINITSELLQIIEYLPSQKYQDLLCTPNELYNDLKELGYDWNILLETRGWWTINNDEVDPPFLSTMDLLRMRKKLYRPFWLK